MKTISDHILDIIQNSIRAKATLIEIILEEDKKNDLYSLIITDNGCGMKKEILEQATNPFFTSRKTRKVGLGLSLLKQNAEKAGGSFKLKSKPELGTELKATFQLSNIDRQPLGNIWETYYLTILCNKRIKLIYRHITETGNFEINSDEIRQLLENVSLQNKDIKNAIVDLIKNNLEAIDAVK